MAPPDLERSPVLKALIHARLQAFEVMSATLTPAEGQRGLQPLGDTALRHAAVCVALIDEGHGANLDSLPRHAHWSTQAALLLTRRAAKLRRHAGQWALPGGRLDEGETPEQAALREMHEEVGLQLDASAVLGRLDDFVSRSGFLITPVVVWAGAAQDLDPNPDEVASIHRIAACEMLRADAPMLSDLPAQTGPAGEAGHTLGHKVLRMPVGSTWIAAPTAAILYQFRELCLLGRATRVAHFEQPVFAWK